MVRSIRVCYTAGEYNGEWLGALEFVALRVSIMGSGLGALEFVALRVSIMGSG